MIAYPKDWKKIGQDISIRELDEVLFEILSGINCNCLAFSGGLDSSLLLHYLVQIHKGVEAFTIGLSMNHPDIYNSRIFSKRFKTVNHRIIMPTEKYLLKSRRDKFEGDTAVKLFYKFVSNHTDKIVSGDGIDEFMCGYYAHQENPSEKVYYDILRKLQKEQLVPLNKNSGKVKVFLPYLDERLISLMSQIPIIEKVDRIGRKNLVYQLAENKLPYSILTRRKYGFCDAFKVKE